MHEHWYRKKNIHRKKSLGLLVILLLVITTRLCQLLLHCVRSEVALKLYGKVEGGTLYLNHGRTTYNPRNEKASTGTHLRTRYTICFDEEEIESTVNNLMVTL